MVSTGSGRQEQHRGGRKERQMEMNSHARDFGQRKSKLK
jgi:hypothetical protein